MLRRLSRCLRMLLTGWMHFKAEVAIQYVLSLHFAVLVNIT